MSLTDQQAILAAGFPQSIHFDGFFAPVRAEADVFELEVEGEIPADLDGAFYRIGADNQFPPSRADDNYINGDGMVTMIRFRDGHADLRSRYVAGSWSAPLGGPCSARIAIRSSMTRASPTRPTTATRTPPWSGTVAACSRSRRARGPTSWIP
jgi:hypothetical protein